MTLVNENQLLAGEAVRTRIESLSTLEKEPVRVTDIDPEAGKLMPPFERDTQSIEIPRLTDDLAL